EFGFISDELIEEIARRLELKTIQVEETIAYYSMLHRKPLGKFHVQVCTNVSCMLRGGNKIWDYMQHKLNVGNKEVTSDGIFSLEEGECKGACAAAPAMQVNYDFYENPTQESVDRIIDGLDRGTPVPPAPRTSGSVHPRLEQEKPLISRRFGIKDSHK